MSSQWHLPFHRSTSLPVLLALTYLLVHSSLVLVSRHRRGLRAPVLLVNAALMAVFAAMLPLAGDAPWRRQEWAIALRLWAPVVFFWWAYLWSGHTLTAFHPPGYSMDASLVAFEGRIFGQPSLWWARRGRPWLTEALHVLYATYFLYTASLGLYLHATRRFDAFEKMAAAVAWGYTVSYALFALLPVLGPRWGLVEARLLHPDEQRQKGYWVTRWLNRVMYSGASHKGGAMPSSHTSTAVVFAVWCWWLWGPFAGAAAAIVVLGMAVGAVYGRYHYLVDVLAGAALGVSGLLLASLWSG
jgi:membrane-associated phospholipid phosphatase